MSDELQLAAQARTEKAQVLRQQDQIPAVLYGHGVDNQSLAIDRKTFIKIFQEAGYTSLINITLKGDKEAKHTVLVREIQYHPVHNHILHIDLYQVRLDEKITAKVPLSFVGESEAVKDMGGVLVRNLDEIELTALPQNLPREIEVNIAAIKDFDKVIYISDLPVPEGVELHHEAEDAVALVQPPRTEEELEALDEEVAEDVEGVEGIEEDVEGEEGEDGEATEGEPTDGEAKPEEPAEKPAE